MLDTASFFSFYDITEKLAIVIGMFTFGLVQHISGSMRNSAVALSVFFIISLVILIFTRLKKVD
jgi:UMF1 family MFS transporter